MTDTIKNEPRKNPEQNTEPLERPVSSASSTASNASLPPAKQTEETDTTLTEFDNDTETIDDQSKLKELPKSEDDGLSTTSSASSMSALPKAKQFNLSVLASGEISKTKTTSVDKKQISVPKRGKSRSKSGDVKVDKEKDKDQDSNKVNADKLTMGESKTTTSSSPKETTSKSDDKPETTPIDSNSSISPRPISKSTETTKADITDEDDENIPEDKVENPSKKNLASQRGLKGRKTNQTEFILKKIIGFGRFF